MPTERQLSSEAVAAEAVQAGSTPSPDNLLLSIHNCWSLEKVPAFPQLSGKLPFSCSRLSFL